MVPRNTSVRVWHLSTESGGAGCGRGEDPAAPLGSSQLPVIASISAPSAASSLGRVIVSGSAIVQLAEVFFLCGLWCFGIRWDGNPSSSFIIGSCMSLSFACRLLQISTYWTHIRLFIFIHLAWPAFWLGLIESNVLNVRQIVDGCTNCQTDNFHTKPPIVNKVHFGECCLTQD